MVETLRTYTIGDGITVTRTVKAGGARRRPGRRRAGPVTIHQGAPGDQMADGRRQELLVIARREALAASLSGPTRSVTGLARFMHDLSSRVPMEQVVAALLDGRHAPAAILAAMRDLSEEQIRTGCLSLMRQSGIGWSDLVAVGERAGLSKDRLLPVLAGPGGRSV